ncbi:MAG: hypothetical protein IJD13_06670 [Oscillospiraceae bacterium]|nr:hypothetical protein [Oscillospiraceae bacterium]
MKYIIASICFAALMMLSACSDTVIMTPEYIDPADSSSQISSEPASEESNTESSVPSSQPEEPSSEPSSTQEESSEPEPDIVLTVAEDSLVPLWTDDLFVCSRRTLAYNTDDLAGAGILTYDYLQMTGTPAADTFNACWKNDLIEWENSIRDTVHICALLAKEEQTMPLPYRVDLSASVFDRGGVISVARRGTQISGEEHFSFMSNYCFDAATGEYLTLWQLFTTAEEETAPRILDALAIQAAFSGYPDLDTAQLFMPADFSCGENGFVFHLTTENGIIDLTVPYENFSDILAYPLLG